MKTWISVALLVFVRFLQKGECSIIGWWNPLIASGDGGYGSSTSYVDNGTTVGVTTITIIAISDDSGGVTAYTIVSQDPSNVVFNIANSGLISIKSGVADFATTPVYKLVIAFKDNELEGSLRHMFLVYMSANDAGNYPGTATVKISVNDVPTFPSRQYGFCVADHTASGTTLTNLTATDVVNSGILTYSIATGNTNTDWAINNYGAITTANTLSATTTPGYRLVLYAADASLTGSTTVLIYVGSCCSGATAVSPAA